MNQFKDLGIKSDVKTFTGDKTSIKNLLNREITVVDYKIEASKFLEKGDGTRLTLQLLLNGESRVLFSGSSVLKDLIKKVPRDKLPFTTKIIEVGRHFEFS